MPMSRVLAKGPPNQRHRQETIQVDLRIVSTVLWNSAAIFYRLKDHNLESPVSSCRGYSLSEYSLTQLSTARICSMKGRRTFTLPWVSSTFSGDEGGQWEIEADAGRLPSIVELKDLRGDLHVIAAVGRRASIRRWLRLPVLATSISYCDHSPSIGIAGPCAEKLEQKIEAVAAATSSGGDHSSDGTEVDIKADGGLTILMSSWPGAT